MIGHFILSKASQEDLQEIYDYSINVFGINQAITYLEGFQFCFQDLAQNPKMGKKKEMKLKRGSTAQRIIRISYFTGFAPKMFELFGYFTAEGIYKN